MERVSVNVPEMCESFIFEMEVPWRFHYIFG